MSSVLMGYQSNIIVDIKLFFSYKNYLGFNVTSQVSLSFFFLPSFYLYLKISPTIKHYHCIPVLLI